MADNGFDKSLRLLSAIDFSYLKKDAKSFSTKWLKIYYKKSKNNSLNSRVGISVTKKVGKANKRNLCKRIIRDTFRNSSFKNEGLDFIVLVSPRLFTNSKEPTTDLKNTLNFAFKNIARKKN